MVAYPTTGWMWHGDKASDSNPLSRKAAGPVMIENCRSSYLTVEALDFSYLSIAAVWTSYDTEVPSSGEERLLVGRRSSGG